MNTDNDSHRKAYLTMVTRDSVNEMWEFSRAHTNFHIWVLYEKIDHGLYSILTHCETFLIFKLSVSGVQEL